MSETFVTINEHVQSFCMSLERVDRAVSEKDVIVEPVPQELFGVDAFGFTDGKTIWLNANKIQDELNDLGIDNREMFVALFRALNYHELGHVLFTPRHDGKFLDFSTDHAIQQMLIALEEGRIETMVVVGRTAIAKLLEVSYATLVNQPDENGEKVTTIPAYVLCYGREYLTNHDWHLPRHPKATEIKALCHEYNRLNLPSQKMRAIAIARELVKMSEDQGDVAGQIEGVMERGQDSAMNIGNPVPVRKQPNPDDAQDVAENNRIDVLVKQEKKDDAAPASPDKPDDGPKVEPNRGKGDIQPPDPGKADIPDLVADLLGDADVQEMIKQGLEDMERAVIGGKAALDRVPILVDSTKPALPALCNERTRVVRAIRRMVADVESERSRRQYEGRVDMTRLAMSETNMDVFRQMLPGQEDEIPVDVLFAIDCSSSMRGDRIDLAADAAWMMHHAALAIPGSSFACVGFNTDYSTVIKRDTRPNDEVIMPVAKGGTKIYDLIADVAIPYLTQSPIANRYLIVASDGQWNDKDAVSNAVKTLNRSNVSTMHFAITSGMNDEHDTTFKYGTTTKDPREIATVSIKMFTETLRKYAQEMA